MAQKKITIEFEAYIPEIMNNDMIEKLAQAMIDKNFHEPEKIEVRVYNV